MIKLGLLLIIALIFGIVYINKVDKNPKILIYTQIIYIIITIILTSFNVPLSITYLCDVINILIVVYVLFTIKNKNTLYAIIPTIGIGLFIGVGIISALANETNIIRILWSFRNNIRAFIFFLGCVYLLDKKDVKIIFKCFEIMVLLSLVLSLYQFFVLKLGQDNIGGIFGTTMGVNAYMNMLLCMVTSKKIIEFLDHKIKFIDVVVYGISSLVIATVSELKIFYVEFIAIFIIAIFLSKMSKRTIQLIIVSVILIIGSVSVLYTVYKGFNNFFSVKAILKYSKEDGYSSKYDLNRLNAIETINKKLFNTKKQKLLGLGTGNAQVSNIPILNTEMAEKYDKYWKYSWFTQAQIFIENGFLGIITYILSFLLFINFKNIKKDNSKKFVLIIALLSVLNIFYNAVLKMDFAMIWYFALSVSFIQNRKVEE